MARQNSTRIRLNPGEAIEFAKYNAGVVQPSRTGINPGPGTTRSGWVSFVSSNNENGYKIEENKDINNVYSFLNMTPSEIAKRQKERLKRILRKP